jgi:curved DNA-binding protein CbpA
MIGAEFGKTFAAWVSGGRTGAIEWRDDRRRRLFFLANGELVLIQSNLMSESPQRIGEVSELRGDRLRQEVARRRVRGALLETGGRITEHPDVAAPELAPEDALGLMLDAADLFPRPVGFPRVRHLALAQRLPVATEVLDVLLELDGDRSIDDLVAFSPVEGEALLNALALASILGAIEVGAGPRNAAQVRPSAPPPSNDEEPTNLEDLGALLAEEGSEPVLVEPEGASHEVVLTLPPTLDASLGASAARIRKAENHFEVLGLPWDSPPDLLRKAYLALAKELHPDKWSGASPSERAEAERVFERVRAAWEVLGLESSRKAYADRVIHGRQSEEDIAQARVGLIMAGELEYKRAVSEFNAGRLVQAHELFQRAREKLPDDDEVKAYAAYTTFKLNHGRNEEKATAAVAELQDVVRRNERLDQGLHLLGLVAWAQGDETQAKANFIAALRIRPANPDALRELKRLQRSTEPERKAAATQESGGFFSKLFKKK